MRDRPRIESAKDPLAVALGRRGGSKGGLSRAAKLTPEQRRESAKHAARARWGGDLNAHAQLTAGAAVTDGVLGRLPDDVDVLAAANPFVFLDGFDAPDGTCMWFDDHGRCVERAAGEGPVLVGDILPRELCPRHRLFAEIASGARKAKEALLAITELWADGARSDTALRAAVALHRRLSDANAKVQRICWPSTLRAGDKLRADGERALAEHRASRGLGNG